MAKTELQKQKTELENNKKTANAKFEASQKEINSSKTKIQNAPKMQYTKAIFFTKFSY